MNQCIQSSDHTGLRFFENVSSAGYTEKFAQEAFLESDDRVQHEMQRKQAFIPSDNEVWLDLVY
jgi:hypothetical protein